MQGNQVAGNIARVRERIAQTAARVGRSVEEITLVAVSKRVESARIAEAYAAGVRDFGESYMQEALMKIGQPPLDAPDLRWHFIGHLQSNKAREAIGRFALVQSVDSRALAQELAHRAERAGTTVELLLEVKLDPIETKFGFSPDTVLAAAEQIQGYAGVRLRGLMGMAPYGPDAESARPAFRKLRSLFERLPHETQQVLSMGMTNDFEIAIEEGATLLRIGTAIFGMRR